MSMEELSIADQDILNAPAAVTMEPGAGENSMALRRRKIETLEKRLILLKNQDTPSTRSIAKPPRIPPARAICTACDKKGHYLVNCDVFTTAATRNVRLDALNVCTRCLRLHKKTEDGCMKDKIKFCFFCKKHNLPFHHPYPLCSLKFTDHK